MCICTLLYFAEYKYNKYFAKYLRELQKAAKRPMEESVILWEFDGRLPVAIYSGSKFCRKLTFEKFDDGKRSEEIILG